MPTKRWVACTLAAALAVTASGCGGTAERKGPPAKPPSTVSSLPPLRALPPAGARWVLVARPRTLWESAATRHIVHAILPRERLDTLAARTGVDIRRMETAVASGYDTGTLVLVRGAFDAGFVVRELAARMAPQELALDHPFPRRTGYLGEARRTFAALSQRTLATTGAAHTAFEHLLRRAAGKPDAPPPALSGRQVAPLLDRYRDDALVLYAPRPLELPPRSGIGLLLARQRSLAVLAEPKQNAVDFEVELRGKFPPGSVDNFQQLFESLAESDLGRVFGLETALKNLAVHAGPGRVFLRFRIPAARLARGAGMLLGGRPWSWLDGNVSEGNNPP